VAVLCNGIKSDLERRGIPSEKISIVCNGINAEDFQKYTPDVEYMRQWKLNGKKVIGFIGSFYRYEGLDLLVKAFACLMAKRSDIILLLVGGGETEADLKSQIRMLKLEKNVIMPGRISHDRIPGVYAIADIMVSPRYSMRLTELVTPLKPLEAMVMKRALVASDIGGHRELIQDGYTGLLFPPGDVSALSKQIESLIDNHDLYDKLGTQGNAWVCEERSWDRTTSNYQEIYSKILEQN
jgi:glycosyltransferase involved in cell wall biosynthesis